MIGKYETVKVPVAFIPDGLPKEAFWKGVKFALITDGHTPHLRARVNDADFERLFVDFGHIFDFSIKKNLKRAKKSHCAAFAGIDWTRAKSLGQWTGTIGEKKYRTLAAFGEFTSDLGEYYQPVQNPWG